MLLLNASKFLDSIPKNATLQQSISSDCNIFIIEFADIEAKRIKYKKRVDR